MKHFDEMRNSTESCMQLPVDSTGSCVCMYSCIHVLARTCIIVYTHTGTHVSLYTSILVSLYTRTHAHTYSRIHVSLHTQIHASQDACIQRRPGRRGAQRQAPPSGGHPRPPRALLRARELETFAGAGSWSWKLEIKCGAGAEAENKRVN